jgi:predicted MFS family arabinose efflux permease
MSASSAVPAAAGVGSQREAGYFGWRVVAAAALGVSVSFASIVVYTFSVFLKPLAAEFGWSREEISRAFAIAAMTVAVASPFLGRALDRWGPRRVIVPCFLIFGSALLALGQLSGSLIQFYLLFFLIGIAGNGTTQMGFSGAVASWFHERRGLAFALVLAGVGVGSIVHPVLAQHLISNFGWRTAYRVLGCLALGIGVPLTVIWVRRREDAARSTSLDGVRFRDALHQREFWVIVAILFLSSIAANGALTHLAAHLTDRGLTAQHAALAAGVLGGAGLAGRLITGWLLDRLFGPRLSLLLLVLMAAGMVMLHQSASLPLALVAAGLIGLGLGGEADVTPFLLSKYFGLRSFSALYGLTWTFYAFAGATGPVLFGRVFDESGSYGVLLLIAAGITLLAALLNLGMRRYPST